MKIKCNVCNNTFDEKDIIVVCGSRRCPFCDCQTGMVEINESKQQEEKINVKLDGVLEVYEKQLKIKENIAKIYQEKNKCESLETNELVTLSVLEAEIQLLKSTIDDLEFIKNES